MLALDKTPEPDQHAFQSLDKLALDELAECMSRPPTAPASFGSAARADRQGRSDPKQDFKDHYSFFAHQNKIAPQQECAEDRDLRLNAQLARQRKQRIVFAPFKAPLKKIAEEVQPKEEGIGSRNFAFPSFEDSNNKDNDGESVEPSSPGQPKSPRFAPSTRRSTVSQRPNTVGAPSSRRKVESRKGESMASAIQVAQNNLKQKEACESIRYLVFGCIGNEGMAAHEKHNVYDAGIGTREEVFHFYKIWNQMDIDGSGDIEFQEFLNFFSENKADWLLGMRCVKYLLGAGANSNATTGCGVEDMLRLIWLKATPEDIQTMMRWFREAAFHFERAPTPPLLSKRKRRELTENFRWINKENKEKISYNDLVDSGLVDSTTASYLMAKYDTDKSNDLDCNEFLELLCPNGYRAHVDAMQAVDKHGNQLRRIKNKYFEGWTIEGAFDNLPINLRLEADCPSSKSEAAEF